MSTPSEVAGGATVVTTIGTTHPNPFDDPFNLTAADYAVNKLISLPLTGEDNFHTWSRTMITALEARNKQGFVDGALIAISETDSRFASWKRCNSLVVTWLLNCISKEIAVSLSSSSTARELWLDLKARYAASNDTRVYEIRQAMGNTRQGTFSVTEYYTKQKVLWDELSYYTNIPVCTCGSKSALEQHQQKEYLMLFLMGLNDSFSVIRSQILSMEPLPGINKAFSMIQHQERQQMITQKGSSSSVPFWCIT
ncbi:uncharacterized protein LOC119983488 [Tripterygium wilfordii]|uniref:uncharacterized protein LOC119983488 n=1 Tax=Tripterygium wilfordii TaxID=458696 RepID=UPI0018F83517|nr:uncharacterized protein LOC119983488 [Tripterygium wilfordii]